MSHEGNREAVLRLNRGGLRKLRLEYRSEALDEQDPDLVQHWNSLAWAVSYLYGDVASWLPDDRDYHDMEDVSVQEYIDETRTERPAERIKWTDGAVNTAALALTALDE